jgi:hypothetical protein
MKQTAVEWLCEQYHLKQDIEIVKQAKEMEKQQGYSEEEVEELIYNVCGTVARLQGIVLNGNHIDTAYKQHKKK